MKPNKVNVAERLKLIRKDLGWTIEMMAKRVDLTKGTFNSYLRGLALPPENIVEKVAEIADVPKEWIYHGDIKDFIESYLLSKGYEEFLKDYPNTVDAIYLEYEKQKVRYSLDEYYPHEVTIYDLFYDIYHPVFKVYVEDTVSEFAIKIQKYPIFSESPDQNRKKYLSLVRTLVHRERPTIKYGEADKIYKIAEIEFNTLVESCPSNIDKFETPSEDFLDFMIRKSKTTRGALEIISIITSQRGLNYDVSSMESDQIIDIFKGIYPELIKVKEAKLGKIH
ncbi:Helix-turn-helix domain-containing protein [Paenisporosarcina quisquiliarum]|nr:Helix-turn-helix domain-containing protein [Paenisporosarcina quisquiliarum]